MPKSSLKGGVWKNTEDEILKVAVMKYGKNQWARISSLLIRKTPKQCKARWYEWLEPSIKKTDWTKEEEEKLLHLAKIMPCQWRTIAPLVGRTAAQCLEHYERLLDIAQAKMEGEEEEMESEDPRRLRQGEVDVYPENKPAKPDPVDMDEDEKEMLSEARARLANTMGKKAKRKARQRQLDESKRLSNLHKRKELQEAGMNYRGFNLKYKGLNYNEEVPFKMTAPEGYFDTKEELEEEKLNRKEFLLNKAPKSTNVDNKPTSAAKKEELEKKNETIRESKIKKIIRESEFSTSRHAKLNLPSPTGIVLSDDNYDSYAFKTGATPTASHSILGTVTPGLMTPAIFTQTPMRNNGLPQTPLHGRSGAFPKLNVNNNRRQESVVARFLKALPEPKNDFEIVLPSEEEAQ